MRSGKVFFIAGLLLAAMATTPRADTLTYHRDWAVLPAGTDGAAAAIALRPGKSPFLSVVYVSALDCQPVVALMSRILYSGYTEPETIELSIDLSVEGYTQGSFTSASRVMRDNIEILLIRLDDNIAVLDAMKEGYSVSITIDDGRAAVRSLSGSKAALSSAENSCKRYMEESG